ncbi:MAG: YceI family protein [Actinomycetota bacterium]
MTTAQAILPKGSWKSDPVHSSVGFSVKHMGAGTFRGSFDDYDVSLSLVEGEPRLIGSARVESVDVKDENLKGHLLSPEFFDAERHPEISFVARDMREESDGIVVEGDLTVKGFTGTVEAHGSISGPVEALGGGHRVGIDLETVVDRHDFGLDWNADLPQGGKVLGDDVTLTVHLELVSEE